MGVSEGWRWGCPRAAARDHEKVKDGEVGVSMKTHTEPRMALGRRPKTVPGASNKSQVQDLSGGNAAVHPSNFCSRLNSNDDFKCLTKAVANS